MQNTPSVFIISYLAPRGEMHLLNPHGLMFTEHVSECWKFSSLKEAHEVIASFRGRYSREYLEPLYVSEVSA